MIIRITGGIGNQMFQYAFKKKIDYLTGYNNDIDIRFYNGREIHNGYELERVFGIKDNIYDGKLKPASEKHKILTKFFYYLNKRMIITSKYMIEVMISYSDGYINAKHKDFYFDGYWQSSEYFEDIKDDIYKIFTFPEFTEEKNIQLYDVLKNNNCVSLHVRRGDYTKFSKFVSLGNTSYYDESIKIIKSLVENPVFIVLSDDIEWCKNHFNEKKMYFVDWNSGDKSFRDMQIMSLCKHNIIANSSFSWWGAWLNNTPNKIVIAPSRIYSDDKRDESHIIPKGWIKVSI